MKKHKILIVDDTPENILVLVNLFKGDYIVVAARSGKEALRLAVLDPKPDIILLDVMMPEMDGYEVFEHLSENPETAKIPVLFVTAMDTEEAESRGLELGAVDFIHKPFRPSLIKARVRNQIELKGYRDSLQKIVDEKIVQVRETETLSIELLAALAEFRDPETGWHAQRLCHYVGVLAHHCVETDRYKEELESMDLDLLSTSAILHDIGKVAVPDQILHKPAKLLPEEFLLMQGHAEHGHRILSLAQKRFGKKSFLILADEIAYEHHEKWDGTGYPRKLAGLEISLPARMTALADVYDALISTRPYKVSFPHSVAVQNIASQRGKHFDPLLVDAFMEVHEQFRDFAREHADCDAEREALMAV